MKRTKLQSFKLLIILFAAIYLASCSGSDKNLIIVPEEASVVASFNIKNLISKGNIKEIQETDFFQEEVLNENDVLIELFNKPGKSGINFAKDAFIFTYKDESTITGVIIPLSNKKKFEEFLDDFMDEIDADLDIEEEDDYSYAEIEGSTILAWNKKLACILNGYFYGDDDALEDVAEELMTNKSKNSFLASDAYKEFKKIGKDINVVVNNKEAELFDISEMLEEADIDEEMNIDFITVGAEFNRGSIDVEFNYVYDDESEKFINKYDPMKGSPDSKTINMLPGDKVVAAMSASFDLDKIIAFLDDHDDFADEVEEEFEEENNMKLKDLLSKLGTDGVGVIHGMKEEGYEPIYSFAVSVSDAKLLDDFLNNNEDEGMEIEKTGSYYTLTKSSYSYYSSTPQKSYSYMGVKDGVLYGTNSEEYVKKISKGISDNNLGSTNVGKQLKNKAYNICINLNVDELPEDMLKMVGHELDDAVETMESTVELFDNLSASADFYSGKIKIELTSKEDNSLALILANLVDDIESEME